MLNTRQRQTINQLLKLPYSEWANIWCALNRWEYPKQFTDKPNWWDKEGTNKGKLTIANPLLYLIQFTIGDKAIMDEWNKGLPKDEREKIFKSILKDKIKEYSK